tara:strand:- start:319 stop:1203 length:885 start_codon:yes stop_codon:yes gene_type:complete
MQAFSTLTYYAYLAWVLFALLLGFAIMRAPLLGAAWLLAVVWRAASFWRLGSRSPRSPARNIEAGGGEDSPLGRVLLVGNGPSIRGSGLGRAIDSFDTVVRFNSFVTKGIEEDTGSKTTLWCHMMQWYHLGGVELVQSLSQCSKSAASSSAAADGSRHCCEAAPLAAWITTCYAWNHVVLAPLVFVPNYLMPMRPPANALTWGLGTYWRAHRQLGLALHQVPTTGFVMLTRLLELTDRVHLVGFDGFSKGKELHYYRERRMQLQVNAAGALLHDWAKEQFGIQQLVDEGKVVLL